MTNSPKHILLLALLSMTLLATSCRTGSEGYRAVSLKVDNRSTEQRLKSITDGYSQWQTFTAKGRFSISGREEMSASMQMRMTCDQYIYISLRGGMGIEGGKIFITPDSLYIIDKINKCYVADEISAFTAGIPITLGSLQRLLLCRTFGSPDAMPADSNGRFTAATTTGNGTAYRFNFNRHNLLDLASATSNDRLASCNVGYSGYIETSRGGIVATSIAIISQMQGTQITMQAEYSPASISWNRPLDDRLSIPASYRRADARLLLQQLGNEL